jgi:hypothetical protein
MAEITAATVGKLREMTTAGLMDCKKALVEANGDLDAAVDLLRKKGIATAATKAGRAANEGVIAQYIQPGARLGILVEINCETDFVAKNENFRAFVKDITLHIAAQGKLLGSPEIKDYHAANGIPRSNGNIVMISAADAENVAIEAPLASAPSPPSSASTDPVSADPVSARVRAVDPYAAARRSGRSPRWRCRVPTIPAAAASGSRLRRSISTRRRSGRGSESATRISTSCSRIW